MRIGQVAKRTGVSADSIRHYEKLGLLPKPPRTPSGYREYGEGAVARVSLIRSAIRFGFTLRQLDAFLGVRRAGGAPCQQVREAGARILDTVDRRIAELYTSRQSIAQILLLWDRRLSQTPAGAPAKLLEALPAVPLDILQESAAYSPVESLGEACRPAKKIKPTFCKEPSTFSY